MSKFPIKKSTRIAIWRAWDQYCYICEQPLDYRELEVDHVLAESLLKDPAELQRIRDRWQIDESFPEFQINDLCNWAPAHRHPCNGSKTNFYAPWVMVCLSMVDSKKTKVLNEIEKLRKERKQSKVLSDLDAALERGEITEEDVQDLLDSRIVPAEDPIVLTFGLNIEELYKNRDFTKRNLGYPALCDWLEKDLQAHLAEILSTGFEYAEPSHRDGEILSVRIVFPELDAAQMGSFSRSWWEVLETSTFRRLYQTAYGREYPPASRMAFHSPVEVALKEEALVDLPEADVRKYGKFSVLSYEFWDDTDRQRDRAEASQRHFPRQERMTSEQIEHEHFAVIGGVVKIKNGEGQEETLDLNDYLTLVGTEGEFADVNPVKWEQYSADLIDWYTNAPPDERGQFSREND